MKKTSIAELANSQHKVTIADEVKHRSQYHMEPALTPRQLASCWLDPSELELCGYRRWKMLVANNTIQLTPQAKETLEFWLSQTSAIKDKVVQFQEDGGFSWSEARPKVLKKYNLFDLRLRPMSNRVNQIIIESFQPLYDENAHANRVKNLLQTVHLHIPKILFSNEGCEQTSSCPVGLEKLLRKMAVESQRSE